MSELRSRRGERDGDGGGDVGRSQTDRSAEESSPARDRFGRAQSATHAGSRFRAVGNRRGAQRRARGDRHLGPPPGGGHREAAESAPDSERSGNQRRQLRTNGQTGQGTRLCKSGQGRGLYRGESAAHRRGQNIRALGDSGERKSGAEGDIPESAGRNGGICAARSDRAMRRRSR